MVYLVRWILEKVCQGHHIFRDESQWVALSLSNRIKRKEKKTNEEVKQDDQRHRKFQCIRAFLVILLITKDSEY